MSLVLGIGTNTAIFTVMDALFLRPLPLDDLDRLVSIHQVVRGAETSTSFDRFSYPSYLDYLERNRFLADLAASQRLPMNLTGGSEPQRVIGRIVTANYFQVLGLRPAQGRFFDPEIKGSAGEAAEVVLSHGTWSRVFGADPAAVGGVLWVNGHPMTVIGIGPEGFKGVEISLDVALWVPMAMYEQVSPYAERFPLTQRDGASLDLIGRLAPGIPVATAERDLRRIAGELELEHPTIYDQMTVRATPLLQTAILPRERGRFLVYARVLVLAVGLVLLIACVNSMHLLAVRGLDRSRELATRAAVGASRGRLIAGLFTETLALFLVGGILSLPVAKWSLDFLWSMRPPELAASAVEPEIDALVVGFLFALTLVAGLVSGLLPALRASRPDLATLLRDANDRPVAGRRFWNLRNLLVIPQIALAVTALITGGLALRSLASANQIDLGFEPDRLVVMTVSPGMQGYEDERIREYYQRVLERVSSIPGIQAAALSENRLLRGGILQRQVYPEGQDQPVMFNTPLGRHRTNLVTPGFFATVGLELVRGRDFDSGDRAGSRPVAIINEIMAETLWPGEDPVGKRFRFDYPSEPLVEVIGVAEQAKYRYIYEDPLFFIYLPLRQHSTPAMTIHARTQGDPGAMLQTVRREVQAVDPALPISDVRTLRSFVEDALWIERASAALMTAFAVLALILAVVGLYGIMHYSTIRRLREIGIRLALGAERRQILGEILREGMLLTGMGVALGWLLGAFLVAPILESSLFGAKTSSLWLYLGVALLLLVTAILGSFFPARRASRVDPRMVLGYE